MTSSETAIAILAGAFLSLGAGPALSEEAKAAPAASPSPAPAPMIKFVSSQDDRGDVSTNSLLEFAWEFRNTGTADLVIERIDTDCSCVSTNSDDVAGRPFPPRTSGHIQVWIDSNRVPLGDMTRSVTVYSNDPRRSMQRLEAHARVKERVKIQPHVPSFRVFKGLAKDQSQTVRLESLEKQLFTIESAESDNPAITVILEGEPGKRRPNNYHELKLALDPAAPVGNQKARVMLRTSHPLAERLFFDVATEMVGTVVIAPAAVDFGEVAKGGEKPSRSVRIGRRRGAAVATPLELTEVATSNPAVKARSARQEDGSYEITVEPDLAHIPEGRLFEGLTVKTNDADQPLLSIPILATVTP